jgi:hypothetical protein
MSSPCAYDRRDLPRRGDAPTQIEARGKSGADLRSLTLERRRGSATQALEARVE